MNINKLYQEINKGEQEAGYYDLKDTILLMASDNYKDRFKAEYYQVKIRCDKLEALLDKYEHNELDFQLSCPVYMLRSQLFAMKQYVHILKERAKIEKVDLKEV